MQINALEFAILSLAVFRISRMLVMEDGPFSIFEWLRVKAWGWRVFECIWCTSVWVGVPAALIWLSEVVFFQIIIMGIALSALTGIIHVVLNRIEGE